MNTEQAEIFVARTSAVFSSGGERYRIVKGRTTARRGAKILKEHEHLFTPFVIDYDVEQPKKRGPGRPRKSETTEATTDAPEVQGEVETVDTGE